MEFSRSFAEYTFITQRQPPRERPMHFLSPAQAIRSRLQRKRTVQQLAEFEVSYSSPIPSTFLVFVEF